MSLDSLNISRNSQNVGVDEGFKISGITTAIVGAVSSKYLVPKMTLTNNLSKDTINFVKQASEEALHTSGLAKKGVEIVRVAENAPEHALEKYLINDTGLLKQLKNGTNAFFHSGTNKVFMPENKLSLACFHEMGHALNFNMNTITRLLQKMRYPATVAPMLLTTVALSLRTQTKSLTKEEKEQLTIVDRIKYFVKNNVGKLSFIAFSPVIIEEALASIKGQGLAKKAVTALEKYLATANTNGFAQKAGNLTKELLKKIKINNTLGLLTYILAGFASAFGAMLAVKTKDSIQRSYDKGHVNI